MNRQINFGDSLEKSVVLTGLPGWSRRQMAFAISAGIVLSLAALYFRPEILSLGRALLALVIIWIGLLPGLLYLRQPAKDRPPFPLMPLTGIFYSVFFGLSSFLAGSTVREGTSGIEFSALSYIDEISIKAQLLTATSMSIMFLSWAISKKTLFHKLPQFYVSGKQNAMGNMILAWGLALGSLAYITFPEIRALPSIGQFLQPAGYVAFALFYILLCRQQLSRLHMIGYFFVTLPVWMGELIATGFLTSLLMIGILWIALRMSMRGALPWKLILAAPVVFIILYPAVNDYRDRFWGPESGASTVQKVRGFFTAVIDFEARNAAVRPLHAAVFRISHIFIFSHVIKETPDNVPYWNGETYRTLFVSWVPRFVWPSKPEEKWGNVFGRRYGLVGEADRSTSMNIPWTIEMYANFGTPAVIIGMALVGVIFGGLERVLNSPGTRSLEQAIGSAVLLPLFFQDSNFTLMTGSLLPLVICLWLYFFVGQRALIPFLGSGPDSTPAQK